MRVAIHQPEHMPWLGYFNKMALADLYIILDTVQFSKNNVQNRNKIYSESSTFTWLTVPVSLENHFNKKISNIRIHANNNWKKRYLGLINNNYHHFPFYIKIFPMIEEIILQDIEFICDLNIKIINLFREILSINTPMVLASSLNVAGTKSQLLLNLCKKVGATCYLSGPSGKKYLDNDIFKEESISINYHEFQHPIYDQHNFHPYLSTLDLLMRCGYDSAKYIY